MDELTSGFSGPVARTTAVAATADALRARILSGALPAGVPLRQEMLAAELGVSRIPLREAFRRLEAEGLVTIVPHKGAVVSAPSLDEISELFDLRALLEPDLIRRAIPYIDGVTLAKAEEVLASYTEALRKRNVPAWGRLNTEFHLVLYTPAARSRSLALVTSLLDQTDRYTRMQLLLTGGQGQSRAQREHSGLIAACRKGDGDRAAALVESHVRKAGQSLISFLQARRF